MPNVREIAFADNLLMSTRDYSNDFFNVIIANAIDSRLQKSNVSETRSNVAQLKKLSVPSAAMDIIIAILITANTLSENQRRRIIAANNFVVFLMAFVV